MGEKNYWWIFRIEHGKHIPKFKLEDQATAVEFNAGNIGKIDPDGFEWVALVANENGEL
jgi:hypothetical protein